GGIAFSIVRELGVPVMYVGVGEGIEDLQSFNAREFVDALFE
ncbi:MAG TPA: signal recognition particle-docking protein FtsY, partial [Candidatus Limiplasma pullistercoris]|nr:signal recognition particle-docking protein FtsY [Candidatus Limiplasma pullistercoris]